MKCPQREVENRQNKDGFTNAGSQRYRCKECGARYTPEKKEKGYQKETRELAIRMYVDGLNFRQIGRHLKVSHTTVMNWVKDHAEKLPEAPVPEEVYAVELDELYTFIEEKKQDLHPDLCRPKNSLHSCLEGEYQCRLTPLSCSLATQIPLLLSL